jgi:hypothetical protein
MKNNPLHHTLTRALAGIRQVVDSDIQHLSLPECVLVLDALLTTDESADRCKQIAKRLNHQLDPTWISEGDLTEVFLVLEVLWRYNKTLVSGEHLAQAVQRLVRSETQVGGPYAVGGVVDITANLRIASFIQMIAKPLPNLDAFFEQATTAEGLLWPYDLYLLTKLKGRSSLPHMADQRLKTPAYRAVSLMTKKRPASQQELRAICDHQQATGFWPAEILQCGQPASHIATTALIIKALMICQSSNPAKSPSGLQQRHRRVAETTKKLFTTRAEPLRQSTLAAVDKICSSEKTFEITLLSYFFARALKVPSKLTDKQLTMLGAANVCVWVAYTIYDDFLDNEGTISLLPVANLTMRASLDCLRAAMPGHDAFGHYAADVFAEMDETNAWEVNNCRFAVQDDTVTIDQLPKYGRRTALAARSFAHALGPMAILSSYAGTTSQQTHYIESAFRHYLIARQLSDDLHDWTSDITAGQASYVVVAIMRDMHLRRGTYDLSALLPSMQKQFRRTTMPHVCLIALRHISMAKQNFASSGLLQDTNNVFALVDKLEVSLRHSLDQHAKAEALVKLPMS